MDLYAHTRYLYANALNWVARSSITIASYLDLQMTILVLYRGRDANLLYVSQVYQRLKGPFKNALWWVRGHDSMKHSTSYFHRLCCHKRSPSGFIAAQRTVNNPWFGTWVVLSASLQILCCYSLISMWTYQYRVLLPYAYIHVRQSTC